MQPTQICLNDKLLYFFGWDYFISARGAINPFAQNSHLKKIRLKKTERLKKTAIFQLPTRLKWRIQKCRKKSTEPIFFLKKNRFLSRVSDQNRTRKLAGCSSDEELFRKYFFNFSKNKSMQMATNFLKIEKKNSDSELWIFCQLVLRPSNGSVICARK